MNMNAPYQLPESDQKAASADGSRRDRRRPVSLPIGSDDWGRDNATGRRFAVELIERMRAEKNPTLVGRVCESIVERGRFGGVEVGFFHELAERAIR